jgi:hypothetical protein
MTGWFLSGQPLRLATKRVAGQDQAERARDTRSPVLD